MRMLLKGAIQGGRNLFYDTRLDIPLEADVRAEIRQHVPGNRQTTISTLGEINDVF